MPRRAKEPAEALQIIVTPSGDEMVVISRAAFERLIAAAQGKVEELIATPQEGKEIPMVPFAVAVRMRMENPIAALRKHRGLTRGELAAMSDVTERYIHQLETGRAHGTRKVLQRVAAAL